MNSSTGQTYTPLGWGVAFGNNVLCYSIVYDKDGLRLSIEDSVEASDLLVSFGIVHAYRTVDEVHFQRTLHETKDLPHRNVYEVHNSQFLNWLREESSGIVGDDEVIRHFIIMTGSDCVEVLSDHAPKFERVPR